MSQRRKLKQQLRQLADIHAIMDAMKNLAMVEVLKLRNRLVNQQQMVRDLERMAADFLDFHPYAAAHGGDGPDVWVLFGSERGFCGDFNDALLRSLDHHLQLAGATRNILLPVGGRLQRRLQDRSEQIRFINGPDVTEDVNLMLNHIVEQISRLQSEFHSVNVHVLFHHADDGRIICDQLIPPFQNFQERHECRGIPPLLNTDPAGFFIMLVDEYLYTALHEIAFMSLLSENYQRIQHMTVALQRLTERTNDLRRHYHMHRQEEITEELEVILLNATNV